MVKKCVVPIECVSVQNTCSKLKDIWALRVRLQRGGRVREPALLNLGIDNKLRGSDRISPDEGDARHGNLIATRAIVRLTCPVSSDQ